MTINLDTRRLKRREDGTFTNEPKALWDKDENLCSFCGRGGCQMREKGSLHDGVLKGVRACTEFIPTLSFSVLAGLDLPLWNTVRVGKAWPERLKTGDEVAIYDTVNGKLVRYMRVKAMRTGPLVSICDRFAASNHAIQAEGLRGSEAATRLLRILRNAYGSNIASPDRDGTAIFLEGR